MTIRGFLCSGVLLVSAAGCAAAPGGSTPAPATSPARLYVPNQTAATISVLDTGSDSVIATIDLRTLGFSANAKPHDIAAEPDGSAWYVSLIGENTILKFDRANRIVGRAHTEVPGLLALDAANDRLYASRSMSAVNAPSAIAMINTADMSVIEEVDVLGPRPHAVAVTPDGGRVFVGSMGSNQVTVYHPGTGEAESFDLAGPTHAVVQFAVSPDGRFLVGTAQLTNQLLVYDISGATPTRVAAVDVPHWPWLVEFSPDGRWVWFGNQHAANVSAVDTRTWEVARTITHPAIAEPHGVAVTADGRKVYISDQGRGGAAPMAGMQGMNHDDTGARTDGQIIVIDAASGRVLALVPTGRYSAGIAIGGGQ